MKSFNEILKEKRSDKSVKSVDIIKINNKKVDTQNLCVRELKFKSEKNENTAKKQSKSDLFQTFWLPNCHCFWLDVFWMCSTNISSEN
jgi:hypothetical protein